MDELLELLSTISSKSLSQSYVLAQTGSIKKKQVNLALLLNIFCDRNAPPNDSHKRKKKETQKNFLVAGGSLRTLNFT